MKTKIKPPAQPKVVLMEAVAMLLHIKFRDDQRKSVEYLLNYFTGADLDGIARDLRNER